ncbi:MAG: prepilin-type N-terminal cleavage/methylation domain-containing protein [Gemmatimonadetes bacterium]|nr:prepilin-type N-terminal cleavage/methylation domain-containing protein [Gemmatimonadota bacterium]
MVSRIGERWRLLSLDGFTLVEVMVALTVLAVGTLSILGAATLALRTLQEAEARYQAVLLAGAVLDSLQQVASPGSGEAVWDARRVRWVVEQRGRLASIELVVESPAGGRPGSLHFALLHFPLPPPLASP